MIFCSDLAFVKDVVISNKCGLSYDAKKPSSLVSIVEKVIKNPDLLLECQRNAKHFAEKHFHFSNYSFVYDTVYRTVVSDEKTN